MATKKNTVVSYAKTVGAPFVNWRMVINNLLDLELEEDTDIIDYEDHVQWKELARGWNTCGCGQLDSRIKRDSDHAPQDGSLVQLGKQFTEQFHCGDLEQALETLDKLDIRAEFVLAEQKYNAAMLKLTMDKKIRDTEELLKGYKDSMMELNGNLASYQTI